MSAVAYLNAIKDTKGSPEDAQKLLQSIKTTYGSATDFYRAAAKESGTTPDNIMQQVEQMATPQQAQPQTAGLTGANASTSVPQTMTPPMQLNANKMDNQTQSLQGQGMATAQAVNQSAQNPSNTYAKGGATPLPPTKQVADASASQAAPSQSAIDAVASTPAGQALDKGQPSKDGIPAPQHKPPVPSDHTQSMLKEYENTDERGVSKDTPKYGGYAQGGPVHENIKNMPLKDIIKLLASHPELAGKGAENGNSPLQGQDMKEGGAVAGQHDPDSTHNPQKKIANMRTEGRSHGAGLLNMNADVPTYADGGSVKMATGSGLEGDTESDNITGYGPDGTPIIQNADGTQQYGNVNDLLGRPESASTLGTGANPTNAMTSSAANAVPQQGASTQATGFATGGEEAAPPGALSSEVADNIPAKLSPGEFVFSADATRFYGLKTLTALQNHARQELAVMANQGNIRTPNDGKNPDQGTFTQDQPPNMNAYDKQGNPQQQEPDGDEAMVSGILKECMGGSNYATGGGVHEEEFAKGGATSDMRTQFGRSNMVSSHPKGGSPLMDYARGGIVTSTSSSLTPKKFAGSIPTEKIKSAPITGGGSLAKTSVAENIKVPKLAKGGLMKNVNGQRNINQMESSIGS